MAKREPVSVKLTWEAYRLAKSASGWKDVGLTEYLSEVVQAAAQKDLDKMEKERAALKKQGKGEEGDE